MSINVRVQKMSCLPLLENIAGTEGGLAPAKSFIKSPVKRQVAVLLMTFPKQFSFKKTTTA